MRKHHFVHLLFCVICCGAVVVDEPPGRVGVSPHFNASLCGACHGRDLPDDAAACGGYVNLYNGQCRQCHTSVSTTCRFHHGASPGEGEMNRIGSLFPLHEKRLTCLTCHDARIQCVGPGGGASSTNPLFLRRYDGGDTTRFCFACHGPAPAKASAVHVEKRLPDSASQARCLYCHGAVPAGKKPVLRTEIEPTCRVCHKSASQVCNRHSSASVVLPLTNPLPLASGSTISCITCHDPHQNPLKSTSLLRMPESESLCKACHGEKQDRKVSE